MSLLGQDYDVELDSALWQEVGLLAAWHRLEPLLHWRSRQRDCGAPRALTEAWVRAYRAATMTGLSQQGALRIASTALGAAGVPAVALKGVRLAWGYYPDPALRPMRDIDLLVPADSVHEAADVLVRAGFRRSTDDPAALAEAMSQDKHLPPFHHLELGVTVELHHRLSEPSGRRGYRVPQLDPAGLIARAEPIDIGGVGILCPAPADLLAHIVTHAAYSHRFDCGPLVLADIHFLAADPSIDWADLRRHAETGGWSRAADLLLALTARWFGPLPVAFAAPPEAISDAAEEALLANPEARAHAELFSDLGAARSPGALAAMVRRRLMPDRQIVASEGRGLGRAGFWPVWASRRIGRLAGGLINPKALRGARKAAAVMRWLNR